ADLRLHARPRRRRPAQHRLDAPRRSEQRSPRVHRRGGAGGGVTVYESTTSCGAPPLHGGAPRNDSLLAHGWAADRVKPPRCSPLTLISTPLPACWRRVSRIASVGWPNT